MQPFEFTLCLFLMQVTELSPEETESTTGGYGKSISHVVIGLKTVKGTKQLKLDPTIYDALIKEKVITARFEWRFFRFFPSGASRTFVFVRSILTNANGMHGYAGAGWRCDLH
jgi:hypothetical protein